MKVLELLCDLTIVKLRLTERDRYVRWRIDPPHRRRYRMEKRPTHSGFMETIPGVYSLYPRSYVPVLDMQ